MPDAIETTLAFDLLSAFFLATTGSRALLIGLIPYLRGGRLVFGQGMRVNGSRHVHVRVPKALADRCRDDQLLNARMPRH
ncbi:MAG TPA: hypothetical protein VKU01_18970 [Bryobacteraceae bacterium]|nr:hypothetical protein [Bryobacteraceae bacterium]